MVYKIWQLTKELPTTKLIQQQQNPTKTNKKDSPQETATVLPMTTEDKAGTNQTQENTTSPGNQPKDPDVAN